jgi:hypothetical protein
MDMTDYQTLLPADLNLRLQRPLVGRGCFGSVFEATEVHADGKPSANRVVRFLPPVAGDEWLQRLRERFARLDDLRLPHVSTHRDGGIVDARFYLVGDRHERTLDSLLTDDEGRPPVEAWQIVEQLIDGLAALHERGIAHGDLRPRRIFIDAAVRRDREWTARIGDPMLGALNWASDGLLVDDDARAYRKERDQSAEPSPQADLYALGCIVCELAGGRHRNPNRSVDEGASQASVEAAAETAGSAHELAILADWLLGERLETIGDAVELRRKLAEESAWRKSRWLTRWARIATVLAAVLLAATAWALWAKSYAEGRLIAVQHDLEDARKKVADLQKENSDQKKVIDEQATKIGAQAETLADQSQTIAARDQETERLKMLIPPPPSPSPEDIARREWSAAVKQRQARSANLNELNEFEALCHTWAKQVSDHAPAEADPEQVGKHLNQWFNELRRLIDGAEVWIISDPAMKTSYLDARANPWDRGKMDAAQYRWEGLKSAARIWNKWADDDARTWATIHSEASKFHDSELSNAANEQAKRALQAWLLEMARVDFVLELTKGFASSKVDYGTHRVATVYTGANADHVWPDGGFAHDWLAKTGSNYKDKTAARIRFDWQPGEPVSVLLEGEPGPLSGYQVHPNLVQKTFAGPLAPYRMHRTRKITSDDENVTLEFRVLSCPGPPRTWNLALPSLVNPSSTGPQP